MNGIESLHKNNLRPLGRRDVRQWMICQALTPLRQNGFASFLLRRLLHAGRLGRQWRGDLAPDLLRESLEFGGLVVEARILL